MSSWRRFGWRSGRLPSTTEFTLQAPGNQTTAPYLPLKSPAAGGDHVATGALVGQGSAIAGSAARSGSITYTTDFKLQTDGVGAAITSNAISTVTGNFITVVVSFADNPDATAWTITNNGTAITWTQQAATNTTLNAKLVLFSGYAGATPPTTITVTATAGARLTGSKALWVASHTDTHATDPLPAGNIFTNVGQTDVSQAITPSGTGSALWMVSSDWNATNTFAPGANNTEGGDLHDAGWQTVAWYRPTVQPRPDSAAFTLSETDTGGKVTYIAFEVRRADSGAATHDTTGALIGQGSAIVGAAAHIAVHATTGALVGQGSTITGSAARTRAHPTTGALVGQGSAITGAAQHNTPHPTSGALVGQGSAIAGSAARTRVHANTGALVGQGSQIAGSAARASGATSHDTTGTLAGQGSAITGSAARTRAHPTSGALVGQGSAIAGTAQHNIPHSTTGALVGQGSAITGTAQHSVLHTTTGALLGQGSAIVGAAARSGTPAAHDTSGALVGQGSAISGNATNGTGSIPLGGGTYYYRPRHIPQRLVKEAEKHHLIDESQQRDIENADLVAKKRQLSAKRLNKATQAVKDSNKRLFDAEQALLEAEREANAAQMRLIMYLEEQEAEIEEESIIVQMMMELL